MTIWAIALVVVGVIAVVSGANKRLATKLDEQPSSDGRFAIRAGTVLVLVGVLLFAVSVVLNVLAGIFTMVVVVGLVVAAVALIGWLRRPRVR